MKIHITIYGTVYPNHQFFYAYLCEAVQKNYISPDDDDIATDKLPTEDFELHRVIIIDIHEELQTPYLHALSQYLNQHYNKTMLLDEDLPTIHEHILNHVYDEVANIRALIYHFYSENFTTHSSQSPQQLLPLQPSTSMVRDKANDFLRQSLIPQIKSLVAIHEVRSPTHNQLSLFQPTQSGLAAQFIHGISEGFYYYLNPKDTFSTQEHLNKSRAITQYLDTLLHSPHLPRNTKLADIILTLHTFGRQLENAYQNQLNKELDATQQIMNSLG
ncbi:MAG: hypothetical protein P1U61_08680 [Legionellaceae bacterium]|nr:hypothetical protein [Legionellaceae bacterium]